MNQWTSECRLTQVKLILYEPCYNLYQLIEGVGKSKIINFHSVIGWALIFSDLAIVLAILQGVWVVFGCSLLELRVFRLYDVTNIRVALVNLKLLLLKPQVLQCLSS